MSIRELEEKLFDEWQEKEKLEYNNENKKINNDITNSSCYNFLCQ